MYISSQKIARTILSNCNLLRADVFSRHWAMNFFPEFFFEDNDGQRASIMLRVPAF